MQLKNAIYVTTTGVVMSTGGHKYPRGTNILEDRKAQHIALITAFIKYKHTTYTFSWVS